MDLTRILHTCYLFLDILRRNSSQRFPNVFHMCFDNVTFLLVDRRLRYRWVWPEILIPVEFFNEIDFQNISVIEASFKCFSYVSWIHISIFRQKAVTCCFCKESNFHDILGKNSLQQFPNVFHMCFNVTFLLVNRWDIGKFWPEILVPVDFFKENNFQDISEWNSLKRFSYVFWFHISIFRQKVDI